MNKNDFWKRDWFIGLLLALVLMLAANSELLQGVERKAYDLAMASSSRAPSDKVAVIVIDDESIANLGRWPWPREIHARMLDILAEGHPKVVGLTTFFTEAQVDPGLQYIQKIAALLGKEDLSRAADAAGKADASPLDAVLQDAAEYLDHDHQLGVSMAASGNVLLPMFFELGESQGSPEQPLPYYVQSSRLTNVKQGDVSRALSASGALYPIPELGSNASAIGHLNSFRDPDGAIRTEPLVVRYDGQYYPSLALMLAAKGLDLGPQDIRVEPGRGVGLGGRKISGGEEMRMHTYFYRDVNGQSVFRLDSFYDVLSGKIPAEKYRDKIVLIGASASGVGDLQVTPVSSEMPAVVTLAHSVSSILQGHALQVPQWAGLARAAALLAVALYLVFVLPRLKAVPAAGLTGALLVALLGAHFLLISTQGIWVQLMLPAILLLTGHLLLTTKHFLMTERDKLQSDAESAESNRMLGLAFQGQGQLDIAFDKFRKVPLDDGLMEVLYNLGLDFERKRQFNKAESVFRYMSEYNPGFRDLPQRMKRMQGLSQSVILRGGSGGQMKLDSDGLMRPTLGRYVIEKELGKGAMGAVYFGKDPRIGREMAIKTMSLSQEFAGKELTEAKERFFREAESAGRLNHPNIVSIYDAGEEHDLAYIAMEYLKGSDLTPHTEEGSLLPLATVMDIAARVADALDYAHRQNVVHRDVKPANIMYDPVSDTLKVTDFGLARITDANRTKTGVIYGTPSYMSPEQLAGQKIEGQSDLFSLGVTLYQLACGKLPFEGDTLAQLMYQIAYESPPDILNFRSDLPPCLVAIINKSLSKRQQDRYADGAEMADALRRCAASLPRQSRSAGVKQ